MSQMSQMSQFATTHPPSSFLAESPRDPPPHPPMAPPLPGSARQETAIIHTFRALLRARPVSLHAQRVYTLNVGSSRSDAEEAFLALAREEQDAIEHHRRKRAELARAAKKLRQAGVPSIRIAYWSLEARGLKYILSDALRERDRLRKAAKGWK